MSTRAKMPVESFAMWSLAALALIFPCTVAAAPDASLAPSIFSPDSVPADAIRHLSHLVLGITGGIGLVVIGLIIYAAVRFRQRPDDDGKEPAQIYGSNPVEVAWTTVPMLIVVALALSTARVIQAVQNAPRPESAVDVEVTGHQWWWEIRYPKLGIVTANELHVPVSTTDKRLPTFMELRSADVVHSFWVPRLAGKTDVVPNRHNKMWIEPTRTGLFVGQCAEYCGTQHARMLLRVYVHTPEDFDRWVQEQQARPAANAAVAVGRLIFERTACVNCHTLNDTIADGRFGPDLTHLMSRETIGAGTLPNSPENLRAWINDPNQFKPGALMPAMKLSPAETRPGGRLPRDAEMNTTATDTATAGLLDAPAQAASGKSIFAYLHEWVTTVDHKKLGLMYIMLGLMFFVIAGIEASLIRIQLAVPNNTFLSPQLFNQLFTMHGTTMVFLVGMPIIFGFANYLVPLMIGARDLAFPRLNAFGFWLSAFGGTILYFSFIGGMGMDGAGSAPDVGWFAYAPLTGPAFSRGHSTDYWIIGVLVGGLGSIATAANIVTTIVCMRCQGMTLMKMPLLVWLNLVMCGMVLLAVSPLTAAQLMLLLDRFLGAHFFDTQAGGSAVLWQHFFWIFGHPEVYVLVIPGFAIASEIIPVFSRKAIFGYPFMVAATVAIAFVSFGVWAHHMFTVGMTSVGNTFFALSTMLVGVPTGIKIFNWIGTMWGGKIRFDTPDAFLHRFPRPIPHRRADRDHARGDTVRLAAQRFLFRGGALSLRARG